MTKTTDVTTAARRIARTHNDYLGGGLLVFDADGNGGQWYKDGTYGFDVDLIVIHMQHGRITGAEAQDLIDRMADQETW